MANTYKISTSAFKHLDTTKTLSIMFRDTSGSVCYPNPQHAYTAKVGNDSGFLKDYPVKLQGNHFLISTSDLTDLSAGRYVLEIWESYTDDSGNPQTSIYPSPSSRVPFTVNTNIMDKTGELIKELGFYDLAKAAAKQAGSLLDVTISSITMAPTGTQPSVKKNVSDTGQVSFELTLPKGDKGDPGVPGKTPVKGKDYWTDADKQAIQDDVTKIIGDAYSKAKADAEKEIDDELENGKW